MLKKLLGLICIIIIAFVFALGFSPVANSVSASAAKQTDKFDDLESFAQVLGLIKSNYVENVDESVVMQGAIKGMLQELDPHSSYFTASQYKSFMTDMKGEFGGLGMTVGMQSGALTVIAPIEDTPAHRAGIRAGDYIIKIDDSSTANMSTDEAVSLMRGKPRTSVTLTLVRKGEANPLILKIMRDIIKIKAVKYKMLPDNIGYVRLTSFQENSAAEIASALKDLEKQKSQGTMLDLRNNPGGSLVEAVNVVSLFVPAGRTAVITKNRSGEQQPLMTRNLSHKDTEHPLVILVDGGSASASEIVAGAMQDYKRAIVVGTTTFGKASVQTLFDLSTGGAIKLTTARYYTPKNRSIQGVGIMPDVSVPKGQIVYNVSNPNTRKERDLDGHLVGEDERAQANVAGETGEAETDIQLQTAIQLIKGMSIYGGGAANASKENKGYQQ
ncbi:S41 family peptidase [Deferribacterales bacterium RsTz2092]|nr:peptidase S41 [Deferribacterales bacterium]